MQQFRQAKNCCFLSDEIFMWLYFSYSDYAIFSTQKIMKHLEDSKNGNNTGTDTRPGVIQKFLFNQFKRASVLI